LLQPVELVVERVRVGRRCFGRADRSFVLINQVFYPWAVRPVVHVVTPVQAARTQQTPSLQLVVLALRTDQSSGDLASRRIRPMR
jgi:hypothetical protein